MLSASLLSFHLRVHCSSQRSPQVFFPLKVQLYRSALSKRPLNKHVIQSLELSFSTASISDCNDYFLQTRTTFCKIRLDLHICVRYLHLFLKAYLKVDSMIGLLVWLSDSYLHYNHQSCSAFETQRCSDRHVDQWNLSSAQGVSRLCSFKSVR